LEHNLCPIFYVIGHKRVLWAKNASSDRLTAETLGHAGLASVSGSGHTKLTDSRRTPHRATGPVKWPRRPSQTCREDPLTYPTPGPPSARLHGMR
jgi:hypothetical protein